MVCPASLRLNWKKEFTKWAVRPVKVEVINGGKPSDRPGAAFDVLVVNYDVLAKHREWVDGFDWDILVCDESHFCKNPKAARTKAVLGATSRGKRTAEGVKARRKLFLTGTPIVNRPVELWPLVEALDPAGMGKNFFSYAKRYCDAKETRFGWDFSGASHLDELQTNLRLKVMVRRLKADVLTELPAKRRQVIEIPANGAAGAVAEELAVYESHRAYIEELEERLRDLEEGNGDFEGHADETRKELARAKSVAFTEMSKARHAVALAKVPHVVEHLEGMLEEGPVVAFAHHRDVIAKIAEAFPGRVATLTGDTSMEARQAAVDDFQAGKIDLFIGNIQAAGVGITLTRASRVVFAELDWVPGNLSQAEDRLHRIGQTASVLVQHLVLEDSLDAVMSRKLIAKQEVIDRALDRKVELPAPAAVAPIAVEVPTYEKAAKAEVNVPEPKPEPPALTPEQVAKVHLGLRRLAGVCDGAAQLDGQGFSKFDARLGHDLAAQSTLSIRQAVLGKKLCIKYRRQLGEGFIDF